MKLVTFQAGLQGELKRYWWLEERGSEFSGIYCGCAFFSS